MRIRSIKIIIHVISISRTSLALVCIIHWIPSAIASGSAKRIAHVSNFDVFLIHISQITAFSQIIIIISLKVCEATALINYE